jgi:predicted lipoprotein with Yx(FWY)xxD motif
MHPILACFAAIACAAALAACGNDEGMGAAAPTADMERGYGPPDEAAEEVQADPARVRGPLVKLRDSQLGPVLFSGTDRALYLFTRDGATSRCHGDCAAAWPPFFAKGSPRAGRGVKRALLGTIPRGGRRQVTYAGQPLYFYVSDPKGKVLCNDIVEFGGTWFALTAQGKPPA